MSFAEWIGTVGVTLLLVAFFLNAFGRLAHDARAYQALNAGGAGIAAFASYLIGFVPFVVLEGTWCAVACVALLGFGRGRRESSHVA